MDRGTSLPGNNRLPLYPLRLLRLKEGETVFVWITHHIENGRIKGLFTRHLDGSSQVIAPEEALFRVKGRPGVWKGYISILEWRAPEKKWVPAVLEVTERSEQDFRGKVARGQVWKVSKAPKEKNKKSPLRAAFLENRPEDTTPPALDVIPKLRNDIFRQADIPLTSDNPLPDLVVVAPVSAAAPGENVDRQESETKPVGVKFSERFSNGTPKRGEDFQALNGIGKMEGGAK